MSKTGVDGRAGYGPVCISRHIWTGTYTPVCTKHPTAKQGCVDSSYDYLDRRKEGWGIWHVLLQQLVLQQPLPCWEVILGTAVLPKGQHSQGNYHLVWGQVVQAELGQQILGFRSILERKEKLWAAGDAPAATSQSLKAGCSGQSTARVGKSNIPILHCLSFGRAFIGDCVYFLIDNQMHSVIIYN